MQNSIDLAIESSEEANVGITAYEVQRLRNIEENNAWIAAHLGEAATDFNNAWSVLGSQTSIFVVL